MKKILMTGFAFLTITFFTQSLNAQKTTEPAKQEEKAQKIELKKANVVPVRRVEKTDQAVEKKEVTPASKEKEAKKMKNRKPILRSKDKPKEAIITPLKNPVENEKAKKNKTPKKLEKIKKMN